jgi:hypothetical protein
MFSVISVFVTLADIGTNEKNTSSSISQCKHWEYILFKVKEREYSKNRERLK